MWYGLGSGWLCEVRPRWGKRVVGPDEKVMVGRGRGWRGGCDWFSLTNILLGPKGTMGLVRQRWNSWTVNRSPGSKAEM